jgi:hypothetical protein
MVELAGRSADVRLENLQKVFGKEMLAVDIDEMLIPAGEFVTSAWPERLRKDDHTQAHCWTGAPNARRDLFWRSTRDGPAARQS